MSYTTPFKFLTEDEQLYLIDDSHQNDRRIYGDCLALMHDVLADFGEMPFYSVLERSQIEDAAADSKSRFTPLADSLRSNVGINTDTALELHTELTSTTRQVTRAVALSFVDEYLRQLIQQYQAIRFQYQAVNQLHPIRRPIP
jgi:hypothetical protein